MDKYDHILVDDDPNNMVDRYGAHYKYFYLVDEQLWYFSDRGTFRTIHRHLQSGFSSILSEDDLMFIEERDQFVAMHARAFNESTYGVRRGYRTISCIAKEAGGQVTDDFEQITRQLALNMLTMRLSWRVPFLKRGAPCRA